MKFPALPGRVTRAFGRRLGTALGSGLATLLVLSPEQAAHIEAAAAILVGFAADFFINRE